MMNPLKILHPVVLAVPQKDQNLRGKDKVAVLRRLARQALRLSARYSELILEKIQKDASGVPLPDRGVFWSLTHKEAYVAAVAATSTIGIDLETLRPVSQALYRRLAREPEWALATQVDIPLFFRFWTAKEAVLKAVGIGFAGLSHCCIREIVDDCRLRLSYDESQWMVQHYWIGRQHLAAITAGQKSVQWHLHNNQN
jgi:4'-phosphopantetheinyl transferase